MESDGHFTQSRGARLMGALKKKLMAKPWPLSTQCLGDSWGLWLELLASESGEGTEVMCPEGMGNG